MVSQNIPRIEAYEVQMSYLNIESNAYDPCGFSEMMKLRLIFSLVRGEYRKRNNKRSHTRRLETISKHDELTKYSKRHVRVSMVTVKNRHRTDWLGKAFSLPRMLTSKIDDCSSPWCRTVRSVPFPVYSKSYLARWCQLLH